MLRSLARLALDALAPRRCAACDEVSVSALCGACTASLLESRRPPPRRHPHGIALASFEFTGAARDALHRGKYRGNREALRTLARLAAPRLIAGPLSAPDAMVPLPLGPRRLRQRGYNQAEEIAGVLSGEAGTRMATGLERVRETAPQANRDEAERRRNVAGAFAWRGASLRGARLWVVDDVLTTGATSAAAVESLVRAGAERVDIVVIAAVS
jgi:ComF family protein